MLTRAVSIGVAVGVPGRDSGVGPDAPGRPGAAVAKSAGGDAVAVFTQDLALKNELPHRRRTAPAQRHRDGALVLHYLPEVDLRTGDDRGHRGAGPMASSDRGLLLPDTFIGVAESINLAGELGRSGAADRLRQFTMADARVWPPTSCCASTSPRATCHPRISSTPSPDARPLRSRRATFLPGDHRKRRVSGHRGGPQHPARSPRARRQGRDRRLRHRVQLLRN